jgi:hypothetical protein
MIFQDHMQVPVSVFRVEIATSEPLKRFIEKMLKLVTNFVEACKSSHISHQKTIQKF